MRAWIQDATMYQFEGMRYIEWCFDFHNPTVDQTQKAVHLKMKGLLLAAGQFLHHYHPLESNVCVCVSIMHQLEATRKANPKEYEATVYTSSYISTYRDNTREKKQWLISTISTAWPSGIPLNQDAGGTSWCWHQASSNAWSHNPDWLAMSPSPTQPPTTVPLHIDSPPGAPGPSTPPHIIFPFEFCNILKPHCGYSTGVHIPCHIKKPAFAWLCIPTIVMNHPANSAPFSGLGVTGD